MNDDENGAMKVNGLIRALTALMMMWLGASACAQTPEKTPDKAPEQPPANAPAPAPAPAAAPGQYDSTSDYIIGKTPSQLARAIEERLSEYLRSPQVNIIVTNPQSSFSKVTVIGQVTTPGPIAFREGMTVLDALLAAGGLAEFASGNRTKLVRKDASGKTTERRVKAADLIKEGKLKENVDLRPGDLLIVPESYF
jgi:hypothetical protein